MGKITISIQLSNNIDLANAKNNFIPSDKVRSLVIDNVLVDTGATTLCLPKKYIELLGIPHAREVVVSTATGKFVTNIYNNAMLSIQGRDAIVEIIELHDDALPLLGVIPMEMLGVEVDIIKHEIRLLPDHSKDTYLLAY
jgi:predicted aspartyl protease